MRRSRCAAAAMCGAVALVSLACGGDGEPTASDGSDAELVAPGQEPTDSGDGADGTAIDGDAAQAAVLDAAERADVDPDAVEVVTQERVTWPDSALGCPQDGQFYTQALVEGYRLVLEAGGQTLHYHGETDGAPQYCAEPGEPAETGATGTADP